MHSPEWSIIPFRDLILEFLGCGEDFGSIVAADVESLRECCSREETFVDSPWLEETGCVGC